MEFRCLNFHTKFIKELQNVITTVYYITVRQTCL